ncbi:MAG: exosortase/archaeosortase family protein [Candidatus Omnitrophica bacterium]|nr:exosortase/archaeosortase family protein [Candidatus Omnitrophota bacterium]
MASRRQVNQVEWGILFGMALLALFRPTLEWMATRFDAPDSFYSHGWLVPLASAWLIWQRRPQLQACRLRPTYVGLWLLVPMAVLHVMAAWLRVHFVSGFALVGAIWALVWTLWGRQALWALRAPLLFLLFMVPLPGVLLIAVSFHMKLAAASVAAHVVQAFGIPAAQAGSTIRVPGGMSIIVDDTCSGLRSLISLLALAILWTCSLSLAAPRWHRLLLVLGAVPIALLANIVRIVVLILLAVVYGPRAAEGFIHYGSGLVVFGVALLALAGLSKLLQRWSRASSALA